MTTIGNLEHEFMETCVSAETLCKGVVFPEEMTSQTRESWDRAPNKRGTCRNRSVRNADHDITACQLASLDKKDACTIFRPHVHARVHETIDGPMPKFCHSPRPLHTYRPPAGRSPGGHFVPPPM
jgi:hypothetical protein